jgi:menaquinone-dependent protoporphyrinogen oxidase
VLVAYATKYGSTIEVAAAVATTLRDGGMAVEVRAAREVTTLEQYDAVVLGAPLYIGRWPRDARRFLSRHRQDLAKRPVAIFALGPIGTDPEELQGSKMQLKGMLAKHAWLTPVRVEVFVGKYDPARLRFPDSLLARLPASPLYQKPASDNRDWAAIRAWARGLVSELQQKRVRP